MFWSLPCASIRFWKTIVVCACAALQSTCCGVMLEMSVSECVSRVVTDRVCVRVTNIGHVISNTHNSQLANMKSRKDCRKLGWDVFVCLCVCVSEFKRENFYKFD